METQVFHYHYGKVDTATPILFLMMADYAWRWWLVRTGNTRVESIEVFQMSPSASHPDSGENRGGGDVIKIVLSHPTLRVTEPGQYCFLRIGQLAQYLSA